MKSNPPLIAKLQSYARRLQLTSYLLRVAFQLARSLLIGFTILYIIAPYIDSLTILAGIFGTCVAISLYFSDWKVFAINERSLLLALDMASEGSEHSVYDRDAWTLPSFKHEWGKLVETQRHLIVQNELQRTLKELARLTAAALAFLLCSHFSKTSLISLVDSAVTVVIHRDVQLTIKKGLRTPQAQSNYVLDGKSIPTIHLARSNVLEISMATDSLEKVVVDLILEGESTRGQSFLLKPDIKFAKNKLQKLTFSVPHSSALQIQSRFAEQDIAVFKVHLPAVPTVTLKPLATIHEPWQDQRELPLLIDITSQKPLDRVNLLLMVDSKLHKETIHTVASDDLRQIHTQHSVLMSKYLESDFATVQIVAEAIDRDHPRPNIGLSNPIKFEVISGYGVYRRILEKLKLVRDELDLSKSKQTPKVSQEALNTLEEAVAQTRKTPYFDTRDRLDFHSLLDSAAQLDKTHKMADLYETHWLLSQLLLEHELINARERDRDFFVAVRGLSRMIEKGSTDMGNMKEAEKRLLSFLKERQRHWATRVDSLPNKDSLKLWPHVQTKPFQSTIRKVIQEAKDSSKSFETLSKSVSDYRSWIQELETAEDREYQRQISETQKSLQNARNVLRELQERQLKVSSHLDRAEKRDKDSLRHEWPVARLHQNSNITDSKKLEQSLKSLSPRAAARISAALEAMQNTLTKGNAEEFVRAESQSDLAGRLLRLAESASYQHRRSQSRRRRKLSGDRYFGRSLMGGEVNLEREYEVNPRYREEILEDIFDSGYEGRERMILNNYLRQILR